MHQAFLLDSVDLTPVHCLESAEDTAAKATPAKDVESNDGMRVSLGEEKHLKRPTGEL